MNKNEHSNHFGHAGPKPNTIAPVDFFDWTQGPELLEGEYGGIVVDGGWTNYYPGTTNGFQLMVQELDDPNAFDHFSIGHLFQYQLPTGPAVNLDIVGSELYAGSVKLADVAHKTIPELPYGRQRLVELAITLGLKPQALLLDEPAAGVPSAESHIILDAVAGLPKTIGVLIIEHDMDVVFRYSDRIVMMHEGRFLADGTPDEIKSNKDVASILLGAPLSA